MRVGVSSTAYETNLTNGQRDGIGVYTGNLIASLGQVDALDVRRFYYPPDFKSILGAQEEAATRLRAPYPVSGLISYCLGSVDINNSLIKREVDIFHCTDYKIPKLDGVPVITTLYDAIPLKNPEWASNGFRQLKNRVMKNSVRWSDHVVTISDFIKKDVIEYWEVPEESVSVVYCGVNQVWFERQLAGDIDNVKEKYKVEGLYILFVGTFQPRKNLERLIDAYESLPESYRDEYSLVLVGKVGWNSETLMKKIEKLKVTGSCIHIAGASDEELRCLYQSASLFVFPSLYEGFGLPILEAYASRVPVVTSRGGALEEVAGDFAVLVDPISVEEIQNGIQTVLDYSVEKKSEMIRLGIERAHQFTWRAAANKLYQLYQDFV